MQEAPVQDGIFAGMEKDVSLLNTQFFWTLNTARLSMVTSSISTTSAIARAHPAIRVGSIAPAGSPA